MNVYRTWNRIVAVVLLTFLTFVPSLSAGQNKDTSSTKSQSAATRGAAKRSQIAVDEKVSSGAPQEGIKVHGHWTIVIKNPNGAVLSQHEFENSLVNTGPDLLAQLLARMATPGAWDINLLNSQAGGSACGGVGCFIIEPGIATGGSTNLTVNYAANPARTLLQGSFQASSAGDITQVQTIYITCQPSVSPSTCPGSIGPAGLLGAQPFTARTLATPITVQAGQIVQVSVTFTFS